MAYAGREVEPVPWEELEILVFDMKDDASLEAKENLVISVRVGRVLIAGPIGPCSRREVLGVENRFDSAS